MTSEKPVLMLGTDIGCPGCPPGQMRRPGTVRIGGRFYCDPCAKDMQDFVGRSPVRALRPALLVEDVEEGRSRAFGSPAGLDGARHAERDRSATVLLRTALATLAFREMLADHVPGRPHRFEDIASAATVHDHGWDALAARLMYVVRQRQGSKEG